MSKAGNPWCVRCVIPEAHAHEFVVYRPDNKLAWNVWYVVREGVATTWQRPPTQLRWIDHCHHPSRGRNPVPVDKPDGILPPA